MATDSTLPLRHAVLIRLAADERVGAPVPKGSIYSQRPPKEPVWPFTRYEPVIGMPVRATCDGHRITIRLHGFAKPRLEGESIVETAEDVGCPLGASIVAALDGRRLALLGGHAAIRWVDGRLIGDSDEADAFHTIQTFRARCITSRAPSEGN